MSTHHTETNKSKTPLIIGGVVAAAVVIGALVLLTDIDLTKTAKLPEVSVEGGQMPAVDVDVADIKIGSKKIDLKVPTIDVDLPKEGKEADDLGDNFDVDVDVDVDVDADAKIKKTPEN